MKKRSAIVLEELKKVPLEEPTPKNKSINYNTYNKNEAVGHALRSLGQLQQLLYNLDERWRVRHRVEVVGDLVGAHENQWLAHRARVYNPAAYSAMGKQDNHWDTNRRATPEEYLKKRIIDGPVDGRGNKDTIFHVFVTDGFTLHDEQSLSEFDKNIIHWCRQSNPKHFFYYWYRRKDFASKEEEETYDDAQNEFSKQEEEEQETKHWIDMSGFLKELEEKSGPVSNTLKEDLKKIQAENKEMLLQKYRLKETQAELKKITQKE